MKKEWKGSFTIEAAFLLPLIAMVFVLCVWGSFYYHDKNILSSCAYETAFMGSTKAREEESITERMLEHAFLERIEGKCIFFTDISVEAQMENEQIAVEVLALRRNMKVTVKHIAAVTEPEEYIREIRKLK